MLETLVFVSTGNSMEITVQFQYFQYRYFQRGKKIQILISGHYPIFSARHKNLFSKRQKFRVTRWTIPIFSAFSIFSSDIFSPKLLKILELNCTIKQLKFSIVWICVSFWKLHWNIRMSRCASFNFIFTISSMA